MSNTFIVPARLEKAAKELKDNVTMLKACSSEVKEVIAMAAEKGFLRLYTKRGDKCNWKAEGDNLANAYCLPDDIEIVVQDEKPQVPAWVRKKYTVCDVKATPGKDFMVYYPNTTSAVNYSLPAALHCRGWIFKGWLHEGCELLTAIPFGYVNDNGDILIDNSIWYESSTAYASVWQKEVRNDTRRI